MNIFFAIAITQSRHATLLRLWGGALRDETKNGCEGEVNAGVASCRVRYMFATHRLSSLPQLTEFDLIYVRVKSWVCTVYFK